KSSIYIGNVWEDISFSHEPQNTDSSTWTNTLFEISGAGGGYLNSYNRIEVTRFNLVVNLLGNVNQDTNTWTQIRINWSNTFLRTRNAQSLLNVFHNPTFVDIKTAIFDVAGFGHLSVYDGNIMSQAMTLKMANDTDMYGGSSIYNFHNCKWEWRNETAGIFDTGGINVTGKINFYNCGLDGGRDLPSVKT